jgi:hypothetical protein
MDPLNFSEILCYKLKIGDEKIVILGRNCVIVNDFLKL